MIELLPTFGKGAEKGLGKVGFPNDDEEIVDALVVSGTPKAAEIDLVVERFGFPNGEMLAAGAVMGCGAAEAVEGLGIVFWVRLGDISEDLDARFLWELPDFLTVSSSPSDSLERKRELPLGNGDSSDSEASSTRPRSRA